MDKIKSHIAIVVEKLFKNKNYWNDPVWSKVISAVIIYVGGIILLAIYAFIKSLLQNVHFGDVISQIIGFGLKKTPVTNLLLLAFAFISLPSVVNFFVEIGKKIKQKEIIEDDNNAPPDPFESSISFFARRLAKAFPGQRGLKWFDDPKKAVERLEIFFKKPIRFKDLKYKDIILYQKGIKNEYVADPIWWFRGNSNMCIENFKRLSKTKILLDIQELEIKRSTLR